jgi:hypothetical protein
MPTLNLKIDTWRLHRKFRDNERSSVSIVAEAAIIEGPRGVAMPHCQLQIRPTEETPTGEIATVVEVASGYPSPAMPIRLALAETDFARFQVEIFEAERAGVDQIKIFVEASGLEILSEDKPSFSHTEPIAIDEWQYTFTFKGKI